MESSKKRLSCDVIDLDEIDDTPPMKIHKQTPLLAIRKTSSDDDIILIKNPTEREFKILGHMQGAGPDDCLPFKVSESTELVYENESQQIGAEDMWAFLDSHDDEDEQQILQKLFGVANGQVREGEEDEDEQREMEKKETLVWALGGYEAVKDLLYSRMERTSILELPKQPIYTIFVAMD